MASRPDDRRCGTCAHKLWSESDNCHHSAPIRKAAAELGYELKGDRGAARFRR